MEYGTSYCHFADLHLLIILFVYIISAQIREQETRNLGSRWMTFDVR